MEEFVGLSGSGFRFRGQGHICFLCFLWFRVEGLSDLGVAVSGVEHVRRVGSYIGCCGFCNVHGSHTNSCQNLKSSTYSHFAYFYYTLNHPKPLTRCKPP